jgi:hypothetical protein
MHLTEFVALERFSKDISPHGISRTVSKINIPSLIVMVNKEILGFGVFSAFRAGETTILFKGESTHVVLVDDVMTYGVSLSL